MPVHKFFVSHKFPPGEKVALQGSFLPWEIKLYETRTPSQAIFPLPEFPPGKNLPKIRQFCRGGNSGQENSLLHQERAGPLNGTQLPDRILIIGKKHQNRTGLNFLFQFFPHGFCHYDVIIGRMPKIRKLV